MSASKLPVVAALLGVALVALLTWWLPGDSAAQRGTGRAQADDLGGTDGAYELAQEAEDRSEQRAGLSPGDVFHYDVELATAIRVHARDGSAQSTSRQSTGPLTIRAYEQSGGTVIAGFEFGRDASGEVMVTIGAEGNTGEPRFPDTMATQTRLAFLDVLSVWRVVRPKVTDTRAWTAAETDRTGRFVASYTRDSVGGITRRKDEYTELFGPTAREATVQVRSNAQFVLGPFLRQCHGSEWRWTSHRDSGARVEEEIRFSCSLASHEREDPKELAAQRKPRVRILFADVEPEVLDTGDVRRRTIELLRELESGGATVDSLVALLSRFDPAADVVLAKLRDPACEERVALALARALSRAATPASERALVALLNLQPAIAATALGSMLNPSKAAFDALALAHGEGTHEALDAIARIGHRAKTHDPARYAHCYALLIAALESPEQDRVAAVRAAWSLKPTKVPDALRALANHESTDVRVATVMALGYCDDREATALLRDALRNDESDTVRQAAIMALLERRSLRPDSTSAVREILAEVAAGDPSDALRQLANRNLKGPN